MNQLRKRPLVLVLLGSISITPKMGRGAPSVTLREFKELPCILIETTLPSSIVPCHRPSKKFFTFVFLIFTQVTFRDETIAFGNSCNPGMLEQMSISVFDFGE
jgi:hypothetical protein